jgi:transposase
MSIQAVSLHLDMRWETIKNMDPGLLSGLKSIGVDEVARAKGHDYMTVIYDMVMTLDRHSLIDKIPLPT